MKFGIECLIVLVIAAMTSFCVSASDTTTKFQTGPFIGSIDLGESCDNVNISESGQQERLAGDIYNAYSINLCGGTLIDLTKYDAPRVALGGDFGTNSIKSDLIALGADKDTINSFRREIDGKSGAVGSGYVPEYNLKLYIAGFYVSSRTVGHITVFGNESKMISALKTIHVTEAA